VETATLHNLRDRVRYSDYSFQGDPIRELPWRKKHHASPAPINGELENVRFLRAVGPEP
jgi:hypothetical protein